MSIRVKCEQCGKTLTAPDSAAGRKGKCPKCGNVVVLTQPEPVTPTFDIDDAFGSDLPDDDPQPTPPQHAPARTAGGMAGMVSSGRPSGFAASAGQSLGRSQASRAPIYPESSLGGSGGYSRRYLYWLLALLFIPLAVSLLGGESDLPERLTRTLMEHQEALDNVPETADDSAFFAALPDHRISGALLSRDTSVHWLYALAAATAFFAIAYYLLEQGAARPKALLTSGVFTATAGVLALLAFQAIADLTQGYWVTGRGLIVIVFYIVKFIGFSYQSALDPENGFFLSAIGFTFGVGLCEEFIKAIPVVWRANREPALDWRGACVWGFISGVGFGVAEGIMYSGNYYNGIATGEIYLVRFISCVGLHAVWGAAVGIAIVRIVNRQTPEDFTGWLWLTFRAMLVPMILHGLYDTLLKKDMNAAALIIAVLSLGWLALMIEKSIRDQPDYEPQPA